MQFAITPLDQSKSQQVLPLIQMVKSDITAEQWQQYVNSFTGRNTRECGIITVRNATNYYMGVLCYKIIEDVMHQRVMDVTNYVAADILGRNDISGTLLNWLEEQARSRDCQAIHITIDVKHSPIPQSSYSKSIPSQMSDRGYLCDATRLCKKLN
ncbi:hypothetical protein O4H49_04930 [Kiloniella laminariae]|uniref:N-acetyltransferase domain-containing protein n=1 Tax=Kiloniella laminariae TaxID=454162 RepID=A0ABT4LJD5_9PROT|nr:hypothetical protein [Kiloniella laminariae]MCZ4280107.1 hypothetical protein [Kiloniella laminariae]